MGRSNSRKLRKAQGSARQPQVEELEKLTAIVDDLAAGERELASDAEFPGEVEVSGEISITRLRDAVREAERARDLARRRENNFQGMQIELDKKREAQEGNLAKRKTELDELAKSLDAKKGELDHEFRKLAEYKSELASENDRLAAHHAELASMEQAAQSGFAEFRHEQVGRLRNELDERRHRAEEDLTRLEQQAAERRRAAEEELGRRAAVLNDESAELDVRRRELELQSRRLKIREQYLDQEAMERGKEHRERLQSECDLAKQESRNWQQRHDAMRELVEQRGKELAAWEALELRFEHRKPEEVLEEITALRRENAGLRKQVAAMPVADKDRLVELQTRYHDLTVDREELFRKNEELLRYVEVNKISAIERENARILTAALEQMNQTLRSEIEQQTAKLETLQGGMGQNPPFPACSAMDDNAEFARNSEPARGPVELAIFIPLIRQAIAAHEGLYYSEADLRCFVAGMAASRLHLLQGISGIGKTRLPEAFAKVVGASYEIVAVAAEWRTPQDLMGYYNAFERKFYETDFTQALYRAQLPLYRDKPFFVVLDEMNLAHPEQYFSDLLSLMERKEGNPGSDQHLRLLSARVDPAPRLLKDGRDLKVPGNVWFVGTANHDETTVSFADKTYDRAHVLELPPKPDRFEAGNRRPLTPIALTTLNSAFNTAQEKYEAEALRVLSFFEEQFGDQLRRTFRVSWGSRLERQARAFVPVVVAAGGHIGEAADHLLATKILRKLQGRIEVPAQDLEKLRRLVEERWPVLCENTWPVKSVESLDQEARWRAIS
ncbi:AAA family ATPase [Streptosporangium canum]|uniref:AAA family ATPase n=1 Tax=Streptosporangium canum TaxID=324952 RepID=UPI0037BBD12E